MSIRSGLDPSNSCNSFAPGHNFANFESGFAMDSTNAPIDTANLANNWTNPTHINHFGTTGPAGNDISQTETGQFYVPMGQAQDGLAGLLGLTLAQAQQGVRNPLESRKPIVKKPPPIKASRVMAHLHNAAPFEQSKQTQCIDLTAETAVPQMSKKRSLTQPTLNNVNFESPAVIESMNLSPLKEQFMYNAPRLAGQKSLVQGQPMLNANVNNFQLLGSAPQKRQRTAKSSPPVRMMQAQPLQSHQINNRLAHVNNNLQRDARRGMVGPMRPTPPNHGQLNQQVQHHTHAPGNQNNSGSVMNTGVGHGQSLNNNARNVPPQALARQPNEVQMHKMPNRSASSSVAEFLATRPDEVQVLQMQTMLAEYQLRQSYTKWQALKSQCTQASINHEQMRQIEMNMPQIMHNQFQTPPSMQPAAMMQTPPLTNPVFNQMNAGQVQNKQQLPQNVHQPQPSQMQRGSMMNMTPASNMVPGQTPMMKVPSQMAHLGNANLGQLSPTEQMQARRAQALKQRAQMQQQHMQHVSTPQVNQQQVSASQINAKQLAEQERQAKKKAIFDENFIKLQRDAEMRRAEEAAAVEASAVEAAKAVAAEIEAATAAELEATKAAEAAKAAEHQPSKKQLTPVTDSLFVPETQTSDVQIENVVIDTPQVEDPEINALLTSGQPVVIEDLDIPAQIAEASTPTSKAEDVNTQTTQPVEAHDHSTPLQSSSDNTTDQAKDLYDLPRPPASSPTMSECERLWAAHAHPPFSEEEFNNFDFNFEPIETYNFWDDPSVVFE